MIRLHLRDTAIRASTIVYTALLIAYPRAFRREYGRQMIQVFRTACVHSTHSAGRCELGRLWLRILGDLVASASSVRMAAAYQQSGLPQRYLYGGAVVVSAVTGYVHLRADADQLVLLILLGGTFLCGAVCPAGAWRWAVIAGLGIPLALAVGHGSAAAAFPHGDSDPALPTPLIPALVAAYCGGVVHRLLPWRSPTLRL